MAAGVTVRGLRELQGGFRKYSHELSVELRDELRVVAEPVRSEATVLARANIRNIGDRWSQMRTGSSRSLVYVAPKAKGRGGSPRANLAPLLLDRAMVPALQNKLPEIYRGLEVMLDRVGVRAGF